MSAMAAMPVARRFGIPLAVTFHALGRVRRQHQARADRFPDSRFEIEDEIVRQADCIIAECPQDRRDLIDLYGADPRRISMVPCGFDSEEMAPMDQREARKLVRWTPGAFYLLQLGRMVPRKGIDNVIRALGRLRTRHHIDARLCVVGGNIATQTDQDMPELLRLRDIAREEGVLDAVEFAGRRGRNQLRRYYCAADVFVSTPWYEPFGITPVEAMACATPVVGSDTGGIRYSVAEGETGFLVPPRDPDSLAEKLAILARDRELARRMGQAGARRVNRLFTWREVGDELAEVFEVLVRQRPRPAASRPSLPYGLPPAHAARRVPETES
jgi:glycosyltransferase involved in cell wall biosynthesis